MRRSAAPLVWLIVLSSTVCAAAEPSAPPDTAPESTASGSSGNVDEARARFQRGVELYRERSFDAALAEFARAYELAPNHRVLYNIAQVQVERHDYASALRYFQDYLRQGAADMTPERREQVEREIASLQARIAELTVRSNVPGAELSIDGVVVGTLPLSKPLLVSSGVRRLVLRKPGYSVAERTVSVAGGDRPAIELNLEPVRVVTAEPSLASAGARAPSSRPVPAGVWIGVAATTALAGTAVVFGILTSRADDDLDNELSRFPGDSARIDDRRSRLKLYAGLTDGFAAGAAVSALVTTYALLAGSGGGEQPSAKAARRRPSTAGTRLIPTGNGVSLLGRF